MHFFYSFFRRSLDRYNEDNTKDENKFFMLNSINLGQIILKQERKLLYKDMNKVWKEYLKLKFNNRDITKFNMILNHLITSSQDSVFEALGYLSQFQKTGMDSEVYDRKMSWDTYAVEVD